MGSPFWGTGIFSEAGNLVVDFVFGQLGMHRLEARAVVQNGRGNSALAKLGAICEVLLRRSFIKGGERMDQNLWTIDDEDWMLLRKHWGPTVH